jgi:hypothetical protein
MADTHETQLLTDLLGEVARADADLSAAHLEARVVQAAVWHSSGRRGSNMTYLVIAAIAVLAVLVPAAFRTIARVPSPPQMSNVATSEQPVALTPVPVAPEPPKPVVRRRAMPPARVVTQPVAQPTFEFVPLMPMTEQELNGPFQLVRVQMPRASLGALRLPLEHPNELVEADVLLGEDGMARAIRVSTSGSTNPWRIR